MEVNSSFNYDLKARDLLTDFRFQGLLTGILDCFILADKNFLLLILSEDLHIILR